MLHDLRPAFAPVAVAALIFGALTASAQAGRLSYVSSSGSDANACTLAAPCRKLQRAVSITAPGGEVRVVDSGGYVGPVAIGKSITISGGGATVFDPITINAPGAVVTLRGLALNGEFAAPGSNGVTIQTATTVHIERCTIHGFPVEGIEIDGNGVNVFVTDSTVRDDASNGLLVSGGTAARLTVANSHFDANGSEGLLIESGETVIDHSSASGNAFVGITVFGGTLRISNSVVTQNTTGIFNASSTVFTRQNNTASGNTTDVSGALTPLSGV